MLRRSTIIARSIRLGSVTVPRRVYSEQSTKMSDHKKEIDGSNLCSSCGEKYIFNKMDDDTMKFLFENKNRHDHDDIIVNTYVAVGGLACIVGLCWGVDYAIDDMMRRKEMGYRYESGEIFINVLLNAIVGTVAGGIVGAISPMIIIATPFWLYAKYKYNTITK